MVIEVIITLKDCKFKQGNKHREIGVYGVTKAILKKLYFGEELSVEEEKLLKAFFGVF